MNQATKMNGATMQSGRGYHATGVVRDRGTRITPTMVGPEIQNRKGWRITVATAGGPVMRKV